MLMSEVKPLVTFPILEGLTIADDMTMDAIEEEQRKALEKEKRAALLQHYRSTASGVPERYWNESLDTYRAPDEKTGLKVAGVRAFCEGKKKGTLLICGGYGLGKTHLGCGIIRERGGLYMPMMKLVYEVDSCMSFKAEKTKSQFLASVCSQPMLVLDEIGRGMQLDRQKEYLYYIANERYGAGLPLVLITNLAYADFATFAGNAVTDRMNETGLVIELTGKSHRKNN